MSDFYTLSDADQAERLGALGHLALRLWEGTFGEPELVKYRENAVFSVRRSDGRRFALRIHRHGYHSNEALRSELFWMQALGERGMDVPPIVPARDGAPFVTVAAPGIAEPRQVDLLGWLPGVPVGSSEEGVALAEPARLFQSAGALAAALHDNTAALALPGWFTRHAWDAEGLVGENPLWGRFWELSVLAPDQRTLLLRARDRAQEDLAKLGTGPDTYGLIHADFVPENLLYDQGRLKLIDFDDSGFGWHMFELATALYFNLDEPDYPAIAASLLAGYRSVRALAPEAGSLLPLFLFLRGTTYLGWIQTRMETQTAKELGPMLIERSCRTARDYLALM